MIEKELLRKLKRKDEKAFEELVDNYQKKIFGLINILGGDPGSSEDLAQEIFLRIFKGIPYFKARAKLSTWIYRIAYNTCLAEMKKKAKSSALLSAQEVENMPDRFHFLSGSKISANELEKIDLEKRMKKTLNMLPPDYRAVLTLFYWNELSYQEIAEAMKMPLGTVKTYLHRARNLLKQKIMEEGNGL
ncbi:MAG: RNA polymerase sigma factor [Candidatus Aminicenantales bacterium]